MKPFRGTEYNRQSTRVYYDPVRNLILEAATAKPGTLVFDSFFEFNVWRVLAQRDKLEILLHHQAKYINWYVDFTVLIALKTRLPNWLESLGVPPFRERYYWIDAKGVLDKKTIERVSGFSDRFSSRVILITPKKIIGHGLPCHVLSMDEIDGFAWLKQNQCGRRSAGGRVFEPNPNPNNKR